MLIRRVRLSRRAGQLRYSVALPYDICRVCSVRCSLDVVLCAVPLLCWDIVELQGWQYRCCIAPNGLVSLLLVMLGVAVYITYSALTCNSIVSRVRLCTFSRCVCSIGMSIAWFVLAFSIDSFHILWVCSNAVS